MDENEIMVPYEVFESKDEMTMESIKLLEEIVRSFEALYLDLRDREAEDMAYDGASCASYVINSDKFKRLRELIWNGEEFLVKNDMRINDWFGDFE